MALNNPWNNGGGGGSVGGSTGGGSITSRGGVGGSGHPNRPNRRNRHNPGAPQPPRRDRNTQNGAASSTTDDFKDLPFDPATMVSPGDPTKGFVTPGALYGSGTSYLDTAAGSAAFNDPKYRQQAVWSMLNQAGINTASPGGANQKAWLQGQVDDLIRSYEGLTLNQSPDLSLENYMYGAFGPTPTPPPGSGPASTSPLTFGDWRQQQNIGQQRFQNMGPAGHHHLKHQYNQYVAGVPTTSVLPGEDWRQTVYYPWLRQQLYERWLHATPTDRGFNPSKFTGPVSVVAF